MYGYEFSWASFQVVEVMSSSSFKEKTIGYLAASVSFKPDTDDVRSSVAIDLVNSLLQEGAIVRVYDPKGMDKVAELDLCKGATLANSALEAVENAEALVLATEWSEFQAIDFEPVRKAMHTPIIFDGRNLFDPDTMKKLGFRYFGIGRAGTG